jgi:hypothetical protein
LATKIQLRRDVEAQWVANNPVLSSGEVGVATDINKFKVGNGSSAWNSLLYLDSQDAEKLKTARIIQLSGDVSGSALFDGSENITISASVASESSVNSLTGTENEIVVSASVGDITLSLPETINANTTGTAASLTNSRIIALSGDVSGSVTFDGSASVDISAIIQPDSVALGTDTTGDYVSSVSASGDGIFVSGTGEGASVSISNTGVTSISGTSNEIDVSASVGSVTLSLPETINADTTGNAATATQLSSAKTIALGGDLSGSTSFDGSSSVVITANIEPDSVALGIDTTGNYVSQISASGNGISVTGSGESASVIVQNTGVHSLTGTANQVSVSASTGSITVGLPSNVIIESDLDVLGNLSVSGSVTIINTETLEVKDKNIEIGKIDEPTDITANGGGITLKGTTDKTFNWFDATDSWTSSEHIDLANGKALKHNGTQILSSTEYVGNAATATKLFTERAITLEGDVTGTVNFDGSASAGISTTLANTAVSAASYGSASAVATFTVDSKGRLTAASNEAIVVDQSAVTNLATDLGNKVDKTGTSDIEITESAKGIILKSANGTRYRITVDNDGSLTTTAVV